MSHVLLPWERSPNYADAEQRTREDGTLVLSLGSEGLEGSQCWAWAVHTAIQLPLRFGVNHGSDLDKEEARRQADDAAKAYGYRLYDQPLVGPDIAERIVGLRLSEAASIAQGAGVTFRIGSENGRVRELPESRRDPNRVTVGVPNGIVTEARAG